MNVVYRTEWTEYESGWGQRPDGVSYAFDKDLLEREIKRIQNVGDYSCYSRAGQIELCIVNEELAKKVHEHGGIYTTVRNEDPGMLGFFKPADPKANIETFRRLVTSIDEAA